MVTEKKRKRKRNWWKRTINVGSLLYDTYTHTQVTCNCNAIPGPTCTYTSSLRQDTPRQHRCAAHCSVPLYRSLDTTASRISRCHCWSSERTSATSGVELLHLYSTDQLTTAIDGTMCHNTHRGVFSLLDSCLNVHISQCIQPFIQRFSWCTANCSPFYGTSSFCMGVRRC